MYLPDINVWLALVFQGHVHHGRAKPWFEGAGTSTCCFCRFTQQGLLRLATSTAVLKRQAVTLVKAWAIYDALANDPRVTFASEPDQLEAEWRKLTRRKTRSPNVWNDAYLAAFAKASNLEVLTFDRAFRQFKGVRATVLS